MSRPAIVGGAAAARVRADGRTGGRAGGRTDADGTNSRLARVAPRSPSDADADGRSVSRPDKKRGKGEKIRSREVFGPLARSLSLCSISVSLHFCSLIAHVLLLPVVSSLATVQPVRPAIFLANAVGVNKTVDAGSHCISTCRHDTCT